MKAILEFNLPEDQEAFEITKNAYNTANALEEVFQQCFRCFRKHGSNDKILQELLEKSPEVEEFIERLEEKFHEILAENKVGL